MKGISMNKPVLFLILGILLNAPTGHTDPVNTDSILKSVTGAVSGDRARDYTMRIWRYDRWNTLPMWKRSSAEAQSIMKERGFDEAEVVNTPADGVTRFEDWTNPIGWDVRQATLEVVDPAGLPDEYRFLCDYLANPTSLCFFSCPTPPEGVTAELVALSRPDPKTMESMNLKGKIVLSTSAGGSLKPLLEDCGALGVVGDARVGSFEDANVWINTWSDYPGGWLMRAGDRRNTFCFSISSKKGAYLRALMKEGKKIIVRARIDSRYYTDDTFPYVTGCVRGTGNEEVLAGGHLYEWGANDNATGCAITLEAVGVLNDLIRSGALPRPKRTLRVWMGQEMYSSIAFAEKNPDILKKTVASLCLDTPAPDYDALSSTVQIHMNPNVCPAFTDALYPELLRRYYASIRSKKLVLTAPFEGGTDTYFAESIIGVPTTFIYCLDASPLHHNSRDVIEKVDARSLRDLSVFTALALYYTANAGFDDIGFLAPLTYNRGTDVILQKSREMQDRLSSAKSGQELGSSMDMGIRTIQYYTGLQTQSLRSILKFVQAERRADAERLLAPYIRDTLEFGQFMVKQFTATVEAKATASSLRLMKPVKKDSPSDLEAASLYPRATRIGPLTLESIKPAEWQGIASSPKWWSPRNWAGASYFWCDGTRNLKEIREAIEMEAGATSAKFDIVAWYRMLEKHGLVEFKQPVKKPGK
jgi:hypothetical protein